MKTLDFKHSFLQGFNYGRSPKARELTNAEIAAWWVDTNPTAFAQGMLDALAGDRFRADLCVELLSR